jgi:hypothetical protein
MLNWLMEVQKNELLNIEDSLLYLFKFPSAIKIHEIKKQLKIKKFNLFINQQKNFCAKFINVQENYSFNNNNNNDNNSNIMSSDKLIHDIKFTGDNISNFKFLDQSFEASNIYYDCCLTHEFKVRGPNYMKDNIKVLLKKKIIIIIIILDLICIFNSIF